MAEIDASDEQPVFESSEAIKVVSTYKELELKRELLRGIYAYGYERPDANQKISIASILSRRDVMLQSGTGNSPAHAISILQVIDTNIREIQALVLSPIHELARMMTSTIVALGDYMNVECHSLTGGTSIGEDIRILDYGVHVISGTPGRVLDMIRRRKLRTGNIKILVLDEADELLSWGFKDRVHDIYRSLPPGTQVVLGSTTLPHDILETTEKFTTNPIRIVLKDQEQVLDGVRQFFLSVEKEDWKFDALRDLYEILTITQVMIFCSSQHKVDWLIEKMPDAEFTVSTIDGRISEQMRSIMVKEFRSGSSRAMVIVDRWVRTVDAQQVPLVINYDLPSTPEHYLRRIRGLGRKGVIINFVTNEDVKMLRDIEQYYGMQIDELPVNLADLL